ncbi:MAG TPA: mannose-6-phosphate isomerase, class I [Polyangiaceae bacterium]|nr:mannose-6-phosphate isomerase, class I [Polyangiaceae bacterium]
MSLLYRLENTVQNYAWGSYEALAELRGIATPTPLPEAEIWMGAHPLAPSRIVGGTGSLVDLIASDPQAMLGARTATEFGRLPFLLKLLAAREPLSLQAHPSADQARAGYAREQAAGTPLSAATRSYKDPHHKPELIAALTPFTALVGFRAPHVTARLFAALRVPVLAPTVTTLERAAPEIALRQVFELVTSSPLDLRQELARATLAACENPPTDASDFTRELAWGARIGALYPGDAGIVLALALNLVVLEPGQALYLPAGNLHAYLEGTGVEIMASSDNVLRGGLTPKHVDATELLSVLDFEAEPVTLVPTEQRGGVTRYVTPAREFELSRVELAGTTWHASVSEPEIVLATRGPVVVQRGPDAVTLSSGASAFIPAKGGDYDVRGTGTVFRARVNSA